MTNYVALGAEVDVLKVERLLGEKVRVTVTTPEGTESRLASGTLLALEFYSSRSLGILRLAPDVAVNFYRNSFVRIVQL